MSDYVRLTERQDSHDVTVLPCELYLCVGGGGIQVKSNPPTTCESTSITHWLTDLRRLAPRRAPSRLTGWGTLRFHRRRMTGSSSLAGDTSDPFLVGDRRYFWRRNHEKKMFTNVTPKLYDHLHLRGFVVSVWQLWLSCEVVRLCFTWEKMLHWCCL